MNNRVLEAIEKGPTMEDYAGEDGNPRMTAISFALRVAKLCGEVAVGVAEKRAKRIGDSDDHWGPEYARRIRSEFDLGGNDGH